MPVKVNVIHGLLWLLLLLLLLFFLAMYEPNSVYLYLPDSHIISPLSIQYILHLAYVTACLLIHLVSKLIGERSKLIQMSV